MAMESLYSGNARTQDSCTGCSRMAMICTATTVFCTMQCCFGMIMCLPERAVDCESGGGAVCAVEGKFVGEVVQ